MFGKHEQPEQAACPPWQLLLRHVVQAERLTHQERDFVVDHIGQCQRCYDIYSALSDAEAELWEQAAKAAGISEREVHLTRSPREALADLWRRIERDQAAQRRQRHRALVFRIARMAAAACVMIAIGVWFMMHKGDSGQSQPGIAAHAGSPAIFAELVTADGRKPLNLNQPITSGAQPQEILLGGMHRVVMNSHTKATFTVEPRRTEGIHVGKTPYAIQLAQGELYVEVVPGNPFTVKTANACLDITGTQFDVLTDGDKTELTLLKGSVRFSALDRPQEAVSVMAGYTSTIVARRVPTAPSPADVLATTAWARNIISRDAIARSREKYANDPDLQWLMTMGRSVYRYQALPDVDTEDYDAWLKANPQPRRASNAFAALQRQQAIKADWIELLMISGNIWQFHYDPKFTSQPLTKLEPQAITRLARHYGLDEKEILKAIGLTGSAIATMPVQDRAPGRRYAEALRHWHDAVMAAVPLPDKPGAHSDLKFFSFQAGHYLAETRTAAYLWVKEHPDKARQLLADKEYLTVLPTPPVMATDGAPDVNVWLKQLHDEANAARSLAPAAMDWLNADLSNTCPGQVSEQQRLLEKFIEELTMALQNTQEH